VRYNEFGETFCEVEGAAWRAYIAVTTNFFGNFKAENYESLLEEFRNA
jgi:hypothetical protein